MPNRTLEAATAPSAVRSQGGLSADLLDTVLVAQLRSVPGHRGPTMLDDLVPRFVTSCTEQVTLVRAALDAGDLPVAAGLAHRLAGSVGTLGARQLAGRFLHFEALARGAAPGEELSRLLTDLEADSAAVVRALADLVH